MSDPARQFREHGYAAIPVFDPALVMAAQSDISEHIDRLSHALYLPFEKSHPEAPLGERLDRIWQDDRSHANLLRVAICTDAHRGPRLESLVQSPELKDAAEHLGDRALDGQVVRLRASIGVFPEHRHEWHSDVAIDDGTSCGRVWITAWIPLTDTGPEHGGLEVVAGRRDAPFHHRKHEAFAIDESELAGQPRMQPQCPVGSVLFLDRFTPHRTLPAGPQARFALVVWMKAGAD